jgi:NAD(P)-dependent dehydrogenase (short-subunit alcohol dehydrogenase family)
MKTRHWPAMLVSSVLASTLAAGAAPEEAPADREARTILVTGASTGIGRRIVERLAADGHRVFAGARKAADLESLGRIRNVQPIRLDVTSPTDIAAAVATITQAGRGLDGLVNNAGVAVTGAPTATSEADFDYVMQVNVYGPYRVTKAFAPLLVASKGRITNIGSISGILSTRDLAAYTMSKHAVEAFTDSLALEMQPLGVAVSVVEPGNYDSRIGASADRRQGRQTSFADRSRFKPPDEVADAVARALLEPQPQRRYLVVPDAREGEFTIRTAITELVQLNEGHPYTYDRDALVKMLDEALAKSRPRRVAVATATGEATAAPAAAPGPDAARASTPGRP